MATGGLVVSLAVVAAGWPSPLSHFLSSRSTRRAAMEASVVVDAGRYGRERLARYATDSTSSGGWEDLPVWNPPTAVVHDRDGVIVDDGDEEPLVVSAAAAAGDAGALLELGRLAFVRYPAQRAPFRLASLDPAARAALGLWSDPVAGVAGLVQVRHGDGSSSTSMTCATCHARPGGGEGAAIIWGVSNEALDLGALILDAPLSGRHVSDPVREQTLAAWGPGRVDVTTSSGLEPAHIPDLRATRFQQHLQHAGAVVQHDVTSLAVRIETLIITSHDGAIRPPREVALGLALYLWSLGDTLPPLETSSTAATLFGQRCGRCHGGDGLAGGLIDVDTIGTDPTLARSPDRGTGAYRATSLRGVGTRTRLLHDGSVQGLADFFDPGRVSGHPQGTTLSAADRGILAAWLHGL
jgi:hypothetical protein